MKKNLRQFYYYAAVPLHNRSAIRSLSIATAIDKSSLQVSDKKTLLLVKVLLFHNNESSIKLVLLFMNKI